MNTASEETHWNGKMVEVCVCMCVCLYTHSYSASTKPKEMPHSQLISAKNILCIICITSKYMREKD